MNITRGDLLETCEECENWRYKTPTDPCAICKNTAEKPTTLGYALLELINWRLKP